MKCGAFFESILILEKLQTDIKKALIIMMPNRKIKVGITNGSGQKQEATRDYFRKGFL